MIGRRMVAAGVVAAAVAVGGVAGALIGIPGLSGASSSPRRRRPRRRRATGATVGPHATAGRASAPGLGAGKDVIDAAAKALPLDRAISYRS